MQSKETQVFSNIPVEACHWTLLEACILTANAPAFSARNQQQQQQQQQQQFI